MLKQPSRHCGGFTESSIMSLANSQGHKLNANPTALPLDEEDTVKLVVASVSEPENTSLFKTFKSSR